MKREQMRKSDWGNIMKGGAGGFLNPPTHPEHFLHVGGRRYSMSLSHAANCNMLDDETREAATSILQAWAAPDIDDPEVVDWIHQVLGYFRDCYSVNGENNVNTDLVVSEEQLDINYHFGVMFIRKFYPDYAPSEDDFRQAYWGKKTRVSSESRKELCAV